MSSGISSSFRCMPTVLTLEVFTFLRPEDLGRAALVKTEWNEFMSTSKIKDLWKGFNLKKLFPSLEIFGKTKWKKYVDLKHYKLSVDDVEPIDNRQWIPLLKELSSVPQEEAGARITLLTIPKGLTLTNAMNLIREPLKGNPVDVYQESSIFVIKLLYQDAQNPVKKTYRVAITNSIIKGSTNCNITKQRELAKQFRTEISATLPTFVFIGLEHIRFAHLSKEPVQTMQSSQTWVRCSDAFKRADLSSDHAPTVLRKTLGNVLLVDLFASAASSSDSGVLAMKRLEAEETVINGTRKRVRNQISLVSSSRFVSKSSQI